MLTLVPEPIEQYAAEHTSALPPLLEELQAVTQERMGALSTMLSGQVEGTLLQMLVAVSRARRVLEIGMFTGFSAQMMAAALPDDGQLITCDVDPKAIELAREYIGRGPNRHKIAIHRGPALDTMKTLNGEFDLVFIDADKENYINYYEAALGLLAPAGLIVVDNVLWSGRVLDPKEPSDHAIVSFNEHVRQDPRVSHVLLTVRDGVMLIRWR